MDQTWLDLLLFLNLTDQMQARSPGVVLPLIGSGPGAPQVGLLRLWVPLSCHLTRSNPYLAQQHHLRNPFHYLEQPCPLNQWPLTWQDQL